MSETSGRSESHRPRQRDLDTRSGLPRRPKEIFALFRDAGKEWIEDKAPKQSAALAYYTLFALGPLLVLAISLAALAFGDAARESVVNQMSSLLGSEGGEAIGNLLQATEDRRLGAFGAIGGLIVLLFTASAVFAQLKDSLNRIWEVETRKREGWKAKLIGAIRKNLLSMAGVVGVGFLLLVSLLASTLLAALGSYLETLLPLNAAVWMVLNILISLAITTLLFALLYKFIPDTRIAWRDVGVGAALTAVFFLAGQIGIGYYLGTGTIGQSFGPGSAMIVILVWIYYSAMLFFYGAEVTQIYANRYGSHVRPTSEARPLADAIREEQASPEREGLDEDDAPPQRRDERRGRGVA